MLLFSIIIKESVLYNFSMCWFLLVLNSIIALSHPPYTSRGQKTVYYISHTPLIADFQLSSATGKHWRKLDNRKKQTILFSSFCFQFLQMQQQQSRFLGKSLIMDSGSSSSSSTRQLSYKCWLLQQKCSSGRGSSG